MKMNVYLSAIKTPLDSEFTLRVSEAEPKACKFMEIRPLGVAEIIVPDEVAAQLAELNIEILEDCLFQTFQNYENNAQRISAKIAELSQISLKSKSA